MPPAMMSEQALADAIATLPRERVAFLPTPLEECPRLSQALGGTRILMKRDDLTGWPLVATRADIWSSAWGT